MQILVKPKINMSVITCKKLIVCLFLFASALKQCIFGVKMIIISISYSNWSKISHSSNVPLHSCLVRRCLRTIHCINVLCVCICISAWVHSGLFIYIRNVKCECASITKWVWQMAFHTHSLLYMAAYTHRSLLVLYIERWEKEKNENMRYIHINGVRYTAIVHNDGSEQRSGVSIYLQVVSFWSRIFVFCSKFLSVRLVPSLIQQYFPPYFSFEV